MGDWDDEQLGLGGESEAWEFFHENSKMGRYDSLLDDVQAERLVSRLTDSLTFEQYPGLQLPDALTPLDTPLGEALRRRTTARSLEACPLSLRDLATILHHAYGVNRGPDETGFGRPFRVVPSAGALYPLEIFFHTSRVEGLQAGLYHYDPTRHYVSFVSPDDKTVELAAALVQRSLAVSTAAIILISAVFERVTLKYGNRGYRFVMLEAGHAAQNVNLAANGLGLGCVNIGGYFDRQIDDLLRLDGLTHSTIYMIGLGRERGPAPTED